jgi:RHS repeat-associated protein
MPPPNRRSGVLSVNTPFQNIVSTGTDDFFYTRTAVEQVTRTYYDRSMAAAYPGVLNFQVLADIQTAFGAGGALNLRNRVASTTFAEGPFAISSNLPVITPETFDQATHYSYDIHGNVDVLLQDIRELEGLGQRLKRMDYEYDLLSGNVHQVSYQAGQWDEFHHRYRYDADNRLLDVRTSRDGRIWERDARYFYYAHGPLARTELGDKQVQGTDHFYTIQGWLKGVNSVRLTAAADAGQDAKTTGLNKPFAMDAMGYVLRYHGNDYSPVGGAGANTMLPAMSTGTYATAFAPRQLYNGNIPSMLTALQDLTGTNLNLHANVYRYDLLNRIKGQTVYKGANSGTDLSTLASNNEYNTSYDFDPNGNFDRHDRRGNLGGTMLMDGLQYWYLTETNALYTPSQPTLPSDRTNKLAYVVDNAGATTYPDDLESQGVGNYAYDAQGRLTQDILAGISAIAWNLQDKVRSVSRASTNASAPNLEFRYGAAGHRTVKVMKPRSAGVQQPASQWERTYYIHDAQGNPMAIYRRTYAPNVGTYNYVDIIQQDDALIYGSARLGNWHGGRLKQRGLTSATTAMTGVTYSAVPSDFWTNGQGGYPTTALSVSRELGLRQYELTDHLGNVRAVVSDRKLCDNSALPAPPTLYRAEVLNQTDFYPFGMISRTTTASGGEYRFGFNGKENDNEVHSATGTSQDFGDRLYDNRTGRWSSVDPLALKYPYCSPYIFGLNNPIYYVDVDGRDVFVFIAATSKTNAGHSAIAVEEYREVEKGIYEKTGRILVAELYPERRPVGIESVPGLLKYRTFNSLNEYLASAAADMNDFQYIQINTDNRPANEEGNDNTYSDYEIRVDLKLKQFMEARESHVNTARTLQYNPETYNCTTFASDGLNFAGVVDDKNIGIQKIDMNIKIGDWVKTLYSRPASSPNKLWNDLLKTKNIESKSSDVKMDPNGLQKYVDNANKYYKR